jgi:hypothetical protein
MFGNNFYHAIIKKTIVAFGRLFSGIYIERREGDSVSGAIIQTLQIPISLAPKEKWLTRLEQDPDLTNNTYISLPRMSFEITGYSYDASRKMGKMNKIICNHRISAGNMYAPVPYNIDITLYIISKTQEDGLQIIEQILPSFGPEYTLSINAVPELNITQDIPISLTSISVSDEYDGDFATRRFVTYTLTFLLKVNLFGATHQSKQIYDVTANISSEEDMSNKSPSYNVTGDPITMTIDEELWSE